MVTGIGLMKEDLQKLKKIRDTVVGLEMQLNLIHSDMDVIMADLLHMYAIEAELTENINILKKDKIVAVVSEYKKSVYELGVVRKNIAQWRNKELLLSRRMEIKERAYKSNIEQFELLKKVLERQKVILLFDPNRKRRKK